MAKELALTDEQREVFRLLGARGGTRRAEKLTARQRTMQARKAVRARWKKAKAAAKRKLS